MEKDKTAELSASEKVFLADKEDPIAHEINTMPEEEWRRFQEQEIRLLDRLGTPDVFDPSLYRPSKLNTDTCGMERSVVEILNYGEGWPTEDGESASGARVSDQWRNAFILVNKITKDTINLAPKTKTMGEGERVYFFPAFSAFMPRVGDMPPVYNGEAMWTPWVQPGVGQIAADTFNRYFRENNQHQELAWEYNPDMVYVDTITRALLECTKGRFFSFRDVPPSVRAKLLPEKVLSAFGSGETVLDGHIACYMGFDLLGHETLGQLYESALSHEAFQRVKTYVRVYRHKHFLQMYESIARFSIQRAVMFASSIAKEQVTEEQSQEIAAVAFDAMLAFFVKGYIKDSEGNRVTWDQCVGDVKEFWSNRAPLVTSRPVQALIEGGTTDCVSSSPMAQELKDAAPSVIEYVTRLVLSLPGFAEREFLAPLQYVMSRSLKSVEHMNGVSAHEMFSKADELLCRYDDETPVGEKRKRAGEYGDDDDDEGGDGEEQLLIDYAEANEKKIEAIIDEYKHDPDAMLALLKKSEAVAKSDLSDMVNFKRLDEVAMLEDDSDSEGEGGMKEEYDDDDDSDSYDD